jgi:hypothetical protein
MADELMKEVPLAPRTEREQRGGGSEPGQGRVDPFANEPAVAVARSGRQLPPSS